MGCLPIFLVVIREMVLSLNLDEAVLTIAIINYLSYWFSPQALMSPVGLWIWYKFLNVFMKCVYTDLALLNEDSIPKNWHKVVRGEDSLKIQCMLK